MIRDWGVRVVIFCCIWARVGHFYYHHHSFWFCELWDARVFCAVVVGKEHLGAYMAFGTTDGFWGEWCEGNEEMEEKEEIYTPVRLIMGMSHIVGETDLVVYMKNPYLYLSRSTHAPLNVSKAGFVFLSISWVFAVVCRSITFTWRCSSM